MSAKSYQNFLQWKQAMFPRLSLEERYDAISDNAELLAITLANDTFNNIKSNIAKPNIAVERDASQRKRRSRPSP